MILEFEGLDCDVFRDAEAILARSHLTTPVTRTFQLPMRNIIQLKFNKAKTIVYFIFLLG